MTVRHEQFHHNGLYFITFTCYKWLAIFEIAKGYEQVYKWFDFLRDAGNHIVGYVIMPNHIHAIIAFKEHKQSINTRVGGGKRFMAYDLVERLKQKNELKLLLVLAAGVNNTDRKRGKLHQVFKASFDCKECRTHDFIIQKLNYIHANPCRGKWNLADAPENYLHSSAKFYQTGEASGYKNLTHFLFLNDYDLS